MEEKKQLILHVIDKLGDKWELGDGIKALLETNKLTEEQMDGILAFMDESIKNVIANRKTK